MGRKTGILTGWVATEADDEQPVDVIVDYITNIQTIFRILSKYCLYFLYKKIDLKYG